VAYTELEQTGSIPPGALETSGLHPTQLYESLGELAIFLLLCLIWRRRKFPGAVALVYAFSYGILRLVVEIFRGDEGPELLATVRIPLLAKAFGLSPTVPLFLSSAQAMALGLSVVAAVVYVVLIRRAASPGDTIRISRNDVSS
jgi:prolipoprotein diacylglyceryltransferase